ncbi:hypothetical protein [Mucilaginibacter sp.]
MSVLANGARLSNTIVYTADKLIEFIESNYLHLTPDAKLNSILEYISDRTSYEGQDIRLPIVEPLEAVKMWFATPDEWWFYLESALDQGLIRKVDTEEVVHWQYDSTPLYNHGLTVAGLSRLIKTNEKENLNLSFIAMAFSSDMFLVLEAAIKPALQECGFGHYIVSEDHVDSDKTINDAILAGIKKARFTIADFTHHRGGVYFEAVYALGRGQKVIYTCHHEHMDKAHFDIRNYQHIVWSDATDFKRQLINKIEAFIKE